jgi:hypothetical protein
VKNQFYILILKFLWHFDLQKRKTRASLLRIELAVLSRRIGDISSSTGGGEIYRTNWMPFDGYTGWLQNEQVSILIFVDVVVRLKIENWRREAQKSRRWVFLPHRGPIVAVAFYRLRRCGLCTITSHHHDNPSIKSTNMASTVAIGLGIAVTAFLVCHSLKLLARTSPDSSGPEAAK